jgi:hypothetical protein
MTTSTVHRPTLQTPHAPSRAGHVGHITDGCVHTVYRIQTATKLYLERLTVV